MEHKTISELLNLSGRTAIVTGGAMGIGQGIVRRLHEAGANVVIADLDEEAARNTAAELEMLKPDSSLAVVADVSKAEAVKAVVDQTVAKFGGVDILVNNAGIFPMQPLAIMTEDDFMKVLDVNLRGVFLFTKMVSEQMKKQGRGGRIVNITSIDAIKPSMVGLAHYDTSKHGLWGFTKNIARELAEDKIWVNALAPGGITTPGVAKMQSGGPKGEEAAKAIETFLQKIPMHRMGDPDDIGRAVLFLASDMASYVTGSQLVVDGGALLA